MYGYHVPPLSKESDRYGFVNEHNIRLSTGIALVLGVYSFLSIVFFGEFDLPMICIGLIWFDFFLKVFFGPEYSIFGNIVKVFCRERSVYWVGAVQKRFAWSLGLVLSSFSFFCILIISGFLPSFGICTVPYEIVLSMEVPAGMAVPFTLPLLLCVVCIVFMTLESVYGYCVGCKIYQKLVEWKWFSEIPGQNCPGGVCSIKKKG